MKYFCNEIEAQKVYPICIKNNGKQFLTLYYYTAYSDSVLHSNEKRLLYFQSPEQMNAFCKRHELKIEEEIAEYDFDAPIENPVDHTRGQTKYTHRADPAGVPFARKRLPSNFKGVQKKGSFS